MSESTDIVVELSEPQTAVLNCRQSVILNMSGQGGGKSQIIGCSSGLLVSQFPEAVGFIAANTADQLSTSTFKAVLKVWRHVFGFSEYHMDRNPTGCFVINKQPPAHFNVIHTFPKYNGIISFWNGAVVLTGSLENYEAHDGKEVCWAHLDETKDTEEAALTDVIMGRLRQRGLYYDKDGELYWDAKASNEEIERRGWKSWTPLYINTSPAVNVVTWLVQMFCLRTKQKEIKAACEKREFGYFYWEFDNKAVVIYSAMHNKENMAPDYFLNQELNMVTEDKKLKLIHGYPFGVPGGAWYPFFSRAKFVGNYPYIKGQTVLQSWDFNVSPYMTLLCAQLRYVTKWIDPDEPHTIERPRTKYDQAGIGLKAMNVLQIIFYKNYCLKDPQNSTESVCIAFSCDHDKRDTEIDYYGDASGRNQIPGLGSVTNYKLIEDYLADYIHNHSKKVKGANIGIFTRRDLMNKLMSGAIEDVELLIDESCQELIEDCENTKVGPKGKDKSMVKDQTTGQKYQEYGHASDAMEYLVCEICRDYIT